VHGMRSTFRDWVGDATETPREIAEAALAHATGNTVEQAYRRGNALEKRRSLMERWSRFIDSRTDVTGVVVNLR
jgi:integrase